MYERITEFINKNDALYDLQFDLEIIIQIR